MLRVHFRADFAWSFGHDSRMFGMDAHGDSLKNQILLAYEESLAMQSNERMKKNEEWKGIRVRNVEIELVDFG